jgi:polyisoprenoid-binding protein YceI
MKIKKTALATLIATLAIFTAFIDSSKNYSTEEIFLTSEYKVDPLKSNLVWSASKVGGEHTGTVKLNKGTLHFDGQKLKSGSFVINMTTIDDTDIKNESMNEKLVGHLKSDDFFSVEKFPTAEFKITKASIISNAGNGNPNYNITGDLTIKGITNPVTFPAMVKITGNNAQASAKIEIDRTKWDIKYRSGLLGTAADKIIYDNFYIDLNIVAGKEVASN